MDTCKYCGGIARSVAEPWSNIRIEWDDPILMRKIRPVRVDIHLCYLCRALYMLFMDVIKSCASVDRGIDGRLYILR